MGEEKGGGERRLRLKYSKRPLPAVLSLQDRFIYKKTAEHFAKPINKLKGKVTMLFITLQIPRGLQVDEVFSFEANQQVMKMGVIEDEAVKRYPMNEGW